MVHRRYENEGIVELDQAALFAKAAIIPEWGRSARAVRDPLLAAKRSPRGRRIRPARLSEAIKSSIVGDGTEQGRGAARQPLKAMAKCAILVKYKKP